MVCHQHSLFHSLAFHYKKRNKVLAVYFRCFLCNFIFNLSSSRRFILLLFVVLQLSMFVLASRHPTYNKIRVHEVIFQTTLIFKFIDTRTSNMSNNNKIFILM
jgi:hypothetical protein